MLAKSARHRKGSFVLCGLYVLENMMVIVYMYLNLKTNEQVKVYIAVFIYK